jgi:hypothetical protein
LLCRRTASVRHSARLMHSSTNASLLLRMKLRHRHQPQHRVNNLPDRSEYYYCSTLVQT